MPTKQYRIIDLDNCVSDDGWRIQHIAWHRSEPNAKYEKYHLLCGFDSAQNKRIFRESANNIVLTGRPLAVRAITEEWLRRNDLRYEHLIMRNNDDHSPSVKLKMKMVNWLWSEYDISPGQISCAFDDHADIVAMYQSLGMTAHQVKIHDIDAYTNPLTKEKL